MGVKRIKQAYKFASAGAWKEASELLRLELIERKANPDSTESVAGRAQYNTPPRTCVGCGTTMYRMRDKSGRLENYKRFMFKKFCSRDCFTRMVQAACHTSVPSSNVGGSSANSAEEDDDEID